MSHRDFMGVRVQQGTKTFDMLEAGDMKRAKRAIEFQTKAAECGYEYEALKKLRAQYSDVC